MCKLFNKIKRWFKREKCFSRLNSKMIIDRGYKCKGMKGVILCVGCHRRVKDCVKCKEYDSCVETNWYTCKKGW